MLIDYLKDRQGKGGAISILDTVATLALFYVPFLLFLFVTHEWYWLILFGLVRVIGRVMMGTVVMHAAVHNALFKSRRLNKIFSYAFELGYGMSNDIWRIQHNYLHHTFTNIAGLDDDLDYSGPLVIHNLFAKIKFWWNKFQRYYWPIAYALNLTLGIFFDFSKAVRYDRKGYYRKSGVHKRARSLGFIWREMLAWKAIYFGIEFGLPIVLGIPFGALFWFWLLVTAANGIVLILVFQLAHVIEGMPQYEPAESERSWRVHEMETTANFSSKYPIVRWLQEKIFGYLGFQIEHHLFPFLSPRHYPYLAPKVAAIATEEGVSYHTMGSMGEAVKAHIKMLKKAGEAQK